MHKRKSKKLYREEQALFFGAVFVLLFVTVLYMYFLSASVVHVVMRKEINQEIAHMSSYVSGLESEYIEAQHKVSNDIAEMQGYVRTNEKIFINRTETSLVLSQNNES
jgi:hypothetical protein